MDSELEVLDTTLRDGAQTHGVTFSLQDKLGLARRLDEIGIRYIEGGWPGSNPKDSLFFESASSLTLRNSEVVAFGSTRRKGGSPDKDPILNALLSVNVKTAVIFGKAWRLHVLEVLKCSLEENLNMVRESVRYLKSRDLEVIFDAEHFFDGFKDDASYALDVIRAADDEGAKTIVLCDTNGGVLVDEVGKATKVALDGVGAPLGIHCHNDSGLAVANTLEAVRQGAKHIQGTMNGLGERCGNADLCQILPALILKLKMRPLISKGTQEEQLRGLTALSHYVYELLNMSQNPSQPYVGRNAFAHKGGVHIDAMMKNSRAYEHVDPNLVGNTREMYISELVGKAGILREAFRLGIDLDPKGDAVERILTKVKKLEAEGYHFENAKATVHLVMMRELGRVTEPFRVKLWRVNIEGDEQVVAKGEVLVTVGSRDYFERGEGLGPVHALDLALRRALLRRFPGLSSVNLINYKVTVVDSVKGTGSKVRVFIEFKDDGRHWATTSLSENIIEASARALVDGYTYSLVLNGLKDEEGG